MANALTGDFEAVLQVSVGTLRRLVAGMHQNASAQLGTPSIPHVVYLRLADDELGQYGSVAAQVGVPIIQLIDGATDRFRVEIGIRARFRPDPGSLPLADVIHGTVRAEYRLRDVDARCRGWEHAGDDYFWFRVVKESVRFDGTVFNDSSAFDLITLLDEATIKARIEKHLRAMLDSTFEPAPQRVGARFRRLKCLAAGPGPNDAAVAIPWGLSSATPQGSRNSINQRFLDGNDWGLAVSADYMLSRMRPMLDPLVGTQINVHHEQDAGIGGGLILDYHVRVDSASVEWLGPMAFPLVGAPAGVFRIRLAGVGWASRLYRSGVFNVGSISAADLRLTFTVDQYVLVTFDSSTGTFSLVSGGAPVVTFAGPFAGLIESVARGYITSQAQARLAGPLGAAQAQLNALSSPALRDPLIKALRGLDPAATPRATRAIFRTEGIVLCGPIALSYRHRPQVWFARTSGGDGFDAIESWIPGGRIDAFHWTWRWFNSPVQDPPGGPGSRSSAESYQLRRPVERITPFGLSLPRERPLPGLDGHGKVCLTVTGVQVDSSTGELIPIRSAASCEQFGFEFKLPYEVGPFIKLYDPRVDIRQGPEIGVLRVGVAESQSSSNTLVLSMSAGWDREAVRVLQSALDGCTRQDAGLVVVVLVDDGVFSASASEIREEVRALTKHLPAPLLVTEDVRAGWSSALALPRDTRDPAWRLVNPAGVVSWAHDDRVPVDDLVAVLNRRLVAGAPADLAFIQVELPVGKRFPIEIAAPHCPPAPLGTGFGGSKIVFVDKDSPTAATLLRRLHDAHAQLADDERPFIAVVLGGANADEADAFQKNVAHDFPTFADSSGDLMRRAGIRMSPTILSLDERAVVVGHDVGLIDPDQDDAASAESE